MIYLSIASIVGISKTLQEQNYLLTLVVFIFVGFMWANVFDKIYKKIMNIQDSIIEPFKGKTTDEKNNDTIQDLQNKIKTTREDISTKNKIEALEKELENLKNPPPLESEKVKVIKPEPIPEPPKNPIVENNKKELKSVLNKLGF